MKARTSRAPLFEQALIPTPLPEGEGNAAAAPLLPQGEGGRRSRPDEGFPTIEALDWPTIERDLDAYGCATAPKLISPETCRSFAALYPDDSLRV
jgi:hypothetical protein